MKHTYLDVVGKTCFLCSELITRTDWNNSLCRILTNSVTILPQEIRNEHLGELYHYSCLVARRRSDRLAVIPTKKTRVSPKRFDELSPSGKQGRIQKLNDEIFAFCERMQDSLLICPVKLTTYIVKCLTIGKLSAVDSFALALYRVRNLNLLRKILSVYRRFCKRFTLNHCVFVVHAILFFVTLVYVYLLLGFFCIRSLYHRHTLFHCVVNLFQCFCIQSLRVLYTNNTIYSHTYAHFYIIHHFCVHYHQSHSYITQPMPWYPKT